MALCGLRTEYFLGPVPGTPILALEARETMNATRPAGFRLDNRQCGNWKNSLTFLITGKPETCKTLPSFSNQQADHNRRAQPSAQTGDIVGDSLGDRLAGG